MARRTHSEYSSEDIRRRINIFLPASMLAFLEVEAKRLSEERGKNITEGSIIRALVTAYYEKRMAGMFIGPND